jgi:hypothetical protein
MTCLEKSPAHRPSSARALIALLDACDDSASWTSDQAHAWWARRGSQILEEASRARDGSRDESRETHTLVAVG